MKGNHNSAKKNKQKRTIKDYIANAGAAMVYFIIDIIIYEILFGTIINTKNMKTK